MRLFRFFKFVFRLTDVAEALNMNVPLEDVLKLIHQRYSHLSTLRVKETSG